MCSELQKRGSSYESLPVSRTALNHLLFLTVKMSFGFREERNAIHIVWRPPATGTTRPHTDLVCLKACLSQTPGEGRVGTCRPNGQHASGSQRCEGSIQSWSGIKPVVTLPGQALGAVIHVQQIAS